MKSSVPFWKRPGSTIVKPRPGSALGKPLALSAKALPSASFGHRAADDLVGRDPVPHGRVDGDDVFQAPEAVVGPLEADVVLAAAIVEVGLHGASLLNIGTPFASA